MHYYGSTYYFDNTSINSIEHQTCLVSKRPT